MTAFDYVALIVLGLSVLASVMRGAVREVMALVSWIGSAVIALHFAPDVSAWLPAALSSPTLRLAVAFIALLLICLLLFTFVSLAASKLLIRSGMTATDRTLGAVFGLLRGVAILVVLVLVGGLTPLPKEPAWRNAWFSPPLEALALVARSYLPQRVAEHIHFDRPADA